MDKLKLYRGNDIYINNHITIKNPTVGDISEFGENKYFSIISTLTSTSSDFKWQLDDIDMNYMEIDDYEMFATFLKDILPRELTSILFGDILDFSKMTIERETPDGNFVLKQRVSITLEHPIAISDKKKKKLILNGKPIPTKKQEEEYDIVIDEYVYDQIVLAIRSLHNLTRNFDIAGNESTRRILIDDAKDEYLIRKDKPYKSQLIPLVSSMVNSPGFKRNDREVFDMNIYAFMDSVKRINKIQNTQLLLQSGYSGFGVNLKEFKQEQLNWMGDL